MIENIREFWYLYILLFVLIIITAFVWKKAASAASMHSKEVNAQIAKAKHNKELREAYGNLTAEIIANAPADALFEGVALCLEAKCQKAEDSMIFYSKLNEAQRAVYAFYYLVSDAKEQNLSAFFKASKRPLTSDAANASKEILSDEVYGIIKDMFDRYDEDNETASVIPEAITKLNADFAEITANLDFYALGGAFIKKNSESFINA